MLCSGCVIVPYRYIEYSDHFIALYFLCSPPQHISSHTDPSSTGGGTLSGVLARQASGAGLGGVSGQGAHGGLAGVQQRHHEVCSGGTIYLRFCDHRALFELALTFSTVVHPQQADARAGAEGAAVRTRGGELAGRHQGGGQEGQQHQRAGRPHRQKR